MPSSPGPGPEKPRKSATNGAGRGSAERNGGNGAPRLSTASSQDIHRTPPHSIEAEQGVLGSMLIAPNEAIPICVERIGDRHEHFFAPAHRTVYALLVELWSAGQAVDLITFTQALRDR